MRFGAVEDVSGGSKEVWDSDPFPLKRWKEMWESCRLFDLFECEYIWTPKCGNESIHSLRGGRESRERENEKRTKTDEQRTRGKRKRVEREAFSRHWCRCANIKYELLTESVYRSYCARYFTPKEREGVGREWNYVKINEWKRSVISCEYVPCMWCVCVCVSCVCSV